MHFKLLDSIGESFCLSAGIVEWELTKNVSLNLYAEEGAYRKNINMNWNPSKWYFHADIFEILYVYRYYNYLWFSISLTN